VVEGDQREQYTTATLVALMCFSHRSSLPWSPLPPSAGHDRRFGAVSAAPALDVDVSGLRS
jgi:hypothetical protein